MDLKFAAELRNVTKFYGQFKAVDEVSFSLPCGSIYGFLGQNGAGKTTTIRMILDIIKPSSGSLTVLGRPTALEVRHRIGYLPEEKGLYKKMKAWSVIAYFATLKGMERKAAKKRAYELLEKYGLKSFVDKPTDALSKGMSQKVQLLASIAHDPEFVILDEPFSGLDPVNQQVMEEIIRDMARGGRTVLFSTHVMQHAERLCDRILLIAQGRKIFDGTIAEAQRTVPRRVRIETEDDISGIRELKQIVTLRSLDQTDCRELNRSVTPVQSGDGKESVFHTTRHWEIEVRAQADAQAVLEFCFERRIRLRSFSQADPTLHEVFMHLVKGDASKENGTLPVLTATSIARSSGLRPDERPPIADK